MTVIHGEIILKPHVEDLKGLVISESDLWEEIYVYEICIQDCCCLWTM